jgi:hypothetical protein
LGFANAVATKLSFKSEGARYLLNKVRTRIEIAVYYLILKIFMYDFKSRLKIRA